MLHLHFLLLVLQMIVLVRAPPGGGWELADVVKPSTEALAHDIAPTGDAFGASSSSSGWHPDDFSHHEPYQQTAPATQHLPFHSFPDPNRFGSPIPPTYQHEYTSPLAQFLPHDYTEGQGGLFRTWSPPSSPAMPPVEIYGPPGWGQTTGLTAHHPQSPDVSVPDEVQAHESSASGQSTARDVAMIPGRFQPSQNGIIQLPSEFKYQPDDETEMAVKLWRISMVSHDRYLDRSPFAPHNEDFRSLTNHQWQKKFFRNNDRFWILSGPGHDYLIRSSRVKHDAIKNIKKADGILIWVVDDKGTVLTSKGFYRFGEVGGDNLKNLAKPYLYKRDHRALLPLSDSI